MPNPLLRIGSVILAAIIFLSTAPDSAAQAPAKKRRPQPPSLTFPPQLPGGKEVVTDSSPVFLEPPATLREDVEIAKVPPTIDFAYYPGQTYEGRPWSNWGDSLAAGGKYYASIGDHLAPQGNAFVYEYDPAARRFRMLADVAELLDMPAGHYVPGKIHGRLDLARDGWIYFSTHRGSTRVTSDQYHYEGDWILRCHSQTGEAEVVAQGPVPKHCIPCSVLDGERLIFYGSTAAGSDADITGIQFFAYDVAGRKLLYSGPDGPARYMILARSTGRVYYVPDRGDSPLMRFDPAVGKPQQIDSTIGIRAATEETPQGLVYTVSLGGRGSESTVSAFNTRTEEIEVLGPAAVGSQTYVATIDADPTGRFLYYVPGAHGGSDQDGSAVVQLDTRTRGKKVIAFLAKFYRDKYGCTPKGTYSVAVDPAGDKLYVTWNASRGGRNWDCCALSVIHIPESERH